MAGRQSRECYKCGKLNHIRKNCPLTVCYKCRQCGHMSFECPAPFRRHGGSVSAYQGRQSNPEQRSRLPADTRRKSNDCASQGTKTLSSIQASSKTCPIDDFFKRYPDCDKISWLCDKSPWSGCRRRSSSSTSSRESSEPSSPVGLPTEEKDMSSNIRAYESVKRVAETIFRLKEDDEKPFCIVLDKKFQDLQEKRNRGLLCIPEAEEELQRGDFDILILHPVHGYIYIEVKAFGDAQDHLDDQEKQQQLADVLRKKTVERLKKGRRALKHLQPPGHPMPIINTIALPNTSRDYLKRVLEKEPTLREALGRCLSPTAERPGDVDVESLCLCSDDLPSKDGVVDEASARVKKAIDQWWLNIIQLGPRNKRNCPGYKCVLASFCNNEDVMTIPEFVDVTGEKFQTPRLDDQQQEVLRSEEKYLFVTGPPGCGKTVVLGKKALQWLHEDKSVFLVYTHGKITNQPAVEFLWQFIEQIFAALPGHEQSEKVFERLHKKPISGDTDCEEFIDEVLAIQDDPLLGSTPQSKKQKPEDKDFRQISKCDISVLKEFFKDQDDALIDFKAEVNQNAEEGGGIAFVIDELNKRTGEGKPMELISKIRNRLPAAKIWCAGPIPTHCPKRFHKEKLVFPYRCPPMTQRLLKAVEPFCLNENTHVFEYATSSTNVPGSPLTDTKKQCRLPNNGPDPVFFPHADHQSKEIVDCRTCADNLVGYLKTTLKIDHAGSTLKGSDVLIVLSGTEFYNHMSGLVHSEFFRQLTDEATGFRVNVYSISDTFDRSKPGISLIHVRAVAGMEKKVVVYVPCQQYQARPLTYAEAVRGQTQANMTPVSHQSGDQIQQSLQSDTENGEGQRQLGLVLEDDQVEDNTQRNIREKLERCQEITAAQKEKLVRLGVLNLHWLWYGASRTLSNTIIFHF